MKLLVVIGCLFAVVNARGYPPSITIPQGNRWSKSLEYIRRGNAAYFDCQANGEPEATYYWTFNGTIIDPSTVNENKMSVDKRSGTLTIGVRFDEEESGDYQCFAKNDYGTSMTPILKIYATVAQTFEGSEGTSKIVDVYESKYVKLQCENIPHSVPAWLFSWEKGKMVKVDTISGEREQLMSEDVVPGDRMMIDQKGNLHILWTEITDHDYFYSCSARNEILLITVKNTKTIKLNVKNGKKDDRAPELKSDRKQNVQVYAGETAKLMCIFTYYTSNKREKLAINWLFKGESVGEGPELTIENIPFPWSESRGGEYMCKARLGDKEDFGYVTLKVVAPPAFLNGKEPEANTLPVEKNAVFRCGTKSIESYAQPPVWLVNAKPLIGCPPRNFECKTARMDGYSECVHEKDVCNNFPDCSDESDEANCLGSCPESQKRCGDQCIPDSSPCQELICDYPGFMCHDRKSCLPEDKKCDGVNDCNDKSDEFACAGGDIIKRNRFRINSNRTELVLPSVGSSDSMCIQCMVTNEFGTTTGDGCLSTIDKILILRGPNSTYDVEPGTLLDITVEATTDKLWQNQMKFSWLWYLEKEDKKTGVITSVPETLPPKGKYGEFFSVSLKGTNMLIRFPDVGDADNEAYGVYNTLKDRVYTVVIQHRYDRVELNFTINGVEIVKPTGVPVVEKAAASLWFIALILAILILFIVVALIVCYMYRNRGGTYLLDKKEHQAGHNPAQELKDSGFHDVGRVDDEYGDDKPKGDEASLSESVKPYESDDDPTEEYGGDFDVSKFNEDGSFIGLYGDKKSKYAKEATV